MPLSSISIRGGVPWGRLTGTPAERGAVVAVARVRPPTVVTSVELSTTLVTPLVAFVGALGLFFTDLTTSLTISLVCYTTFLSFSTILLATDLLNTVMFFTILVSLTFTGLSLTILVILPLFFGAGLLPVQVSLPTILNTFFVTISSYFLNTFSTIFVVL